MRRANRFDRPGESFFAASLNGTLVGICGLNVDPYVERQDAEPPAVGRVRHLYVLSTARGTGVGTALTRRVIEAAREHFTLLRLSTTNPLAARLYERLGFEPTTAAHATHILTLGEPRGSNGLRPDRPR